MFKSAVLVLIVSSAAFAQRSPSDGGYNTIGANRIVRRALPQLTACMNNEPAAKDVNGIVVVLLTLAADGKVAVTEVVGSATDSPGNTCTTQTLGKLHFRAPKRGANIVLHRGSGSNSWLGSVPGRPIA